MPKPQPFAKLVANLQAASTQHNSAHYAEPEVVLWLDPEKHWEKVVPGLRQALPQLLSLGAYAPEQRQGPAIWLKCMIVRTLPEADWPASTVPILYLPGVGKADLRQPDPYNLQLAPLHEYQYTGTLWLQDNGKEWTPAAFLQNPAAGLGRKVAQDQGTRTALGVVLPFLFKETDGSTAYEDADGQITEASLLDVIFPDASDYILRWLNAPDPLTWLGSLSAVEYELWPALLRRCYRLNAVTSEPKKQVALRLEAARSLGMRQGTEWRAVWQRFRHAPRRYPAVPDLLRQAYPAPAPDLFGNLPPSAGPMDSWPQINEASEKALRDALLEAAQMLPVDLRARLAALGREHGQRAEWVWAELGRAPLAHALGHLQVLAETTAASAPGSTLTALGNYYETTGFRADTAMRHALAAVTTEPDRKSVGAVLNVLYAPWLGQLADKFQALAQANAAVFGEMSPLPVSEADFVLFVDALRYDVAQELADRLRQVEYTVDLRSCWSALPSVTPTAKPHISPLAGVISMQSEPVEFMPQLAATGKLLRTDAFRSALESVGYKFLPRHAPLQAGRRYWQEIGDLDEAGHQQGAGLVRYIDGLLNEVHSAIAEALQGGARQVQLVTDHGWLLLPGGLPKAQLSKDLVETRWGRCALIKEGAATPLLRLPWRWNSAVFVAYAPGISFFKAGEEYAHGGLSLQECLIPLLTVERPAGQVALSGKLHAVRWIKMRLRVETADTPDGCLVDLRTTPTDPATSIIEGGSGPAKVRNNQASLIADEVAESKSAAVVLLAADGTTVLDKVLTEVGS